MALSTSTALQTDTWVKAAWDDFVATLDAAPYDEGQGYFDNGYMRIEMAPYHPHALANGDFNLGQVGILWFASAYWPGLSCTICQVISVPTGLQSR